MPLPLPDDEGDKKDKKQVPPKKQPAKKAAPAPDKKPAQPKRKIVYEEAEVRSLCCMYVCIARADDCVQGVGGKD